jgi:hypothetical protein
MIPCCTRVICQDSEVAPSAESNRNVDLIVTDLGGTMVKTDDAIIAAVKQPATERTIYIGDTDHDVRQARQAGVIAAVVKTGGKALNHLHRIEAERPDHLLDSWPDLGNATCAPNRRRDRPVSPQRRRLRFRRAGRHDRWCYS